MARRGALHHWFPWGPASRRRTSPRFPSGVTGGRFPLGAALKGAPSSPLSKVPPAYPPPPPSTAFRVPVGGFPVDSRCRQRSISINHTPPLPIPCWSTHSAPGCTWLSSIRGWRPWGDCFHVPRVPLTREPTCTQAIDPGGLTVNPHPGGGLTAVLVSTVFSRLPVARLPMVGPWFTSPWRLVSQSDGAVACFFPLSACSPPLLYPNPLALYFLVSPSSALYPASPAPLYPYPLIPLSCVFCWRRHNAFLLILVGLFLFAPGLGSPVYVLLSVFTPHRTGPPATLWRGPKGQFRV